MVGDLNNGQKSVEELQQDHNSDQDSDQDDQDDQDEDSHTCSSSPESRPPPRPKFVPKAKRAATHQPDSPSQGSFKSNIDWMATANLTQEPHQVDDTDGVDIQQEYDDWRKRDAARQLRDATRLEQEEQEYEDRMERMELAAKRARERF